MRKAANSILQEIISHKQEELKTKQEKVPLEALRRKLDKKRTGRSFKDALSKEEINFIAEIKKASPSGGIIRADFNPEELARTYEAGGAAALSVLTDEKFFQGKLEFLSRVRKVSSLPILRKDFIIDCYQIYESHLAGADAQLLIASILSKEKIEEFLSLSKELGLATLVEVHTEEELEKVLSTSAEIIGINNRNLETFQVDLAVTLKLSKLIPPGKIIVSESGIKSRAEVDSLRSQGVQALLVGESLLGEKNPGEKLAELRKTDRP